MQKMTIIIAVLGCLVTGCCNTCKNQAVKEEKMTAPKEAPEEGQAQLKKFIERHVAKVAPMNKQLSLTYWDATTTGNKEAYAKTSQLEIEIRKLYSGADDFAFLKKMREEKKIKDPILQRQLEILYLDFQENQIDQALMEKMVKLSTEVQKTFNDFRGTIDGKQVTDNDIYDILKSSKDSAERKQAWLVYKTRGALVRDRVVTLAKLRNQAAKSLGYRNFYEMRLKFIEQDPVQIKKIFDDLAAQTDKPFAELMTKVNAVLAKRYKIKPEDLRAWHYEDPFFQEAPSVGKVDLDPLFKDADQKAIVNDYFKGIGLDPSDILERSDLFEKKGKMPHAYCIDVDRTGDIRILANLRPSEKWTSTLMHEMGHAVYDKFIDAQLPWLLREAAHSFTTEAVAMFFGRLTRNPDWLAGMLKLADDKIAPLREDLKFQLRLSMLIMARWTMVVVHFERELYANPDQDLNKLWWDLKKRYQLLTPPEGRNAPDWASKIHIAAWPVYYHNYMLGEMMASQLHAYLAKQLGKDKDLTFVGQTEIGKFMKEKIFKPGKSLGWDDLLKSATAESLNPKYFSEQFVK